jgi:hypothetical protein
VNSPQERSPTRAAKENSATDVAPPHAGRSAAHRILVLNGRPGNLPVSEQLEALGYDVVADTASPGHALSLLGSALADALVIATDSLDLESVLPTARLARERHACAVVLLTGEVNTAALARIRAVRPHGIVPLPIAAAILDVSIQTALSAVSEAPRARRPHVQANAPEPERFRAGFAAAAARASRRGSTFGIGMVEPGLINTAEAAGRLRGVLRQADMVDYRGQGKLVFLAEDLDSEALEGLGRRMVCALSGTAGASEKPQAAAPGVGMALWSTSEDRAEALLESAEKALVEVQRCGGNGWGLAPSRTGAMHAQPRHSKRAARGRPRRVLQRTLGWLALPGIGWVAASYAGLTSAEQLATRFQELIVWIRDAGF